MTRYALFFAVATCGVFSLGQSGPNRDYRLALTDHKGLVTWSVDGFKVVENSAKPNGSEIGIRGSDASGKISFLGFLFLVPESAPLTGAKCRDGAIAQDKKGNPALKIIRTSEVARPDGIPVALVTYTAPARDGSLVYMVRGFVATGDLCGDLEFYSAKPISDGDTELQKAFASYGMEPNYTPHFNDLVFYAQVLFQTHQYQAAAPVFERALTMVPDNGAPFSTAKLARRVTRDQAGMSYGIAGQISKARAIFEKGVADDPDYPMNYYNLACADAEEKKLADARNHLQEAFDRRSNMNPGESMPVPTQDDSFLPYKSNKDFWAFLEKLQAGK